MSTVDYKAYATREAAALLDGSGYMCLPGGVRNPAERASRDALIALLALAWIQGAIYGLHDSLSGAESAFVKARAEL